MADSPVDDLVVLDMDGVLLHLDLRTEHVRRQLGGLLGQEPRPLIRGLEQACEAVSRDDPVRGQELRRAAWALIDAEEQRAARSCRPAEGLMGLLRALEGRTVALFTNNHRAAVDLALARAGIDPRRFVAIQARQGPGSIKPAAEPLLKILARLERAPARIFMVGDHPADMESAVLATPALVERGVERVVPLGLYGGSMEQADALERAGAWFLAADLAQAATLVTTARAPFGLSMVLLAYNEQALIGGAVREARRFGQTYLARHQIVVVDDGSTDRTAERVQGEGGDDLRLVRHRRNLGMGQAMRSGYRAASEQYIAHLPGDRQVRPAALAELLPLARPERVVLTRYHEIPSGRSRAGVSLVFRLLVRHLGGMTVDFAGTYLFHRRYLPLLDDPRVASDSFLFSFELLQRLVEAGCSVHQLPIHCMPRQVGQSRVLSARRILGVLGEIVRHRIAARAVGAGGP